MDQNLLTAGAVRRGRRLRGGFECVIGGVVGGTILAVAASVGIFTIGFFGGSSISLPALQCKAALGNPTNKALPIPDGADCPTVGTLKSSITDKPGAKGKICLWENVRYGVIQTEHPTGHKTSGTDEDITYGDWGPSKVADSLEHIEPFIASGTKAAKTGSIRCFQWQTETGKDAYPTGQADCLGLQIWAPPGASGLPVAIFIHGGMYVVGASDEWAYEGSRFASRGLVVVAINYRLNVYGFATYDELTRNNGVKDQRNAILWVNQNIRAFGGDPDNIGIFGESAGATSVAVQALHEHNFGGNIIKRMISESNPLGIVLESPEHKEQIWNNFESKRGPAKCLEGNDHCAVYGILGRVCNKHDHFQCMKNNKVQTLKLSRGMMMAEHNPEKVLQDFYGYGPCVDGKFVKVQPEHDIRNLAIPSIQGTNREEGGYFTPIIKEALMAMNSPLLDLDQHEHLAALVIDLFFGFGAPRYYQKNSGFRRVTMPFTDFLFSCPMTYNLGRQCGKVYRYQIQSSDICSAPYKKAGDCASVNQECKGIACHANEVPVVFGTWGEEGSCCSEEENEKYTKYYDQVQSHWYKFFAGGEPWEANGPANNVKVLGMDSDGELLTGYTKYELHSDTPDAGGENICARFFDRYDRT